MAKRSICALLALVLLAAASCDDDEETVASRVEMDDLCRAGVQEACGLKGVVIEETLEQYLARCKAGDWHGCHNAGNYFAVNDRDDAAMPLFRKACANGNFGSCLYLGGLLEDAGKNAEARALYLPHCEDNQGIACDRLGRMEAAAGKATDALNLFLKACTLDRTECESLFYLTREHPEIRPVALPRLEARCKSGVAAICDVYAWILERQMDDPKRAAEYYRRACDGGHEHACEALAELERD